VLNGEVLLICEENSFSPKNLARQAYGKGVKLPYAPRIEVVSLRSVRGRAACQDPYVCTANYSGSFLYNSTSSIATKTT
jgi:hypothetical protein